MLSKIITVLFAVNCISTVNGFIDSKLRVLEPILKCYEANTPEFAGEKKMAERINLDSEADMIKLSCLAIRVSSQTKTKFRFQILQFLCAIYNNFTINSIA